MGLIKRDGISKSFHIKKKKNTCVRGAKMRLEMFCWIVHTFSLLGRSHNIRSAFCPGFFSNHCAAVSFLEDDYGVVRTKRNHA